MQITGQSGGFGQIIQPARTSTLESTKVPETKASNDKDRDDVGAASAATKAPLSPTQGRNVDISA